MNLAAKLELAVKLTKALQELAEAEFEVGGFQPFDVYSVKPAPHASNQFLLQAAEPGSENPIVKFKVTIEPA